MDILERLNGWFDFMARGRRGRSGEAILSFLADFEFGPKLVVPISPDVQGL